MQLDKDYYLTVIKWVYTKWRGRTVLVSEAAKLDPEKFVWHLKRYIDHRYQCIKLGALDIDKKYPAVTFSENFDSFSVGLLDGEVEKYTWTGEEIKDYKPVILTNHEPPKPLASKEPKRRKKSSTAFAAPTLNIVVHEPKEVPGEKTCK